MTQKKIEAIKAYSSLPPAEIDELLASAKRVIGKYLDTMTAVQLTLVLEFAHSHKLYS